MFSEEDKRYFDIVSKRKSVRSFRSDEIEEEKVSLLLDAIHRAPSAANRQPWHFVVLRGEDKEKINHLFDHPGFRTAPLALAACAEPQSAWVRKSDGVNFAWVDVTIAVTEVTLAATALGLGSCWVAAMDVGAVKEALCLADHVEFISMVILGYPKDPLKAELKDRKPLDRFIHYGTFG